MKKSQLKKIIREILEDESPGRMRDMHKDLQDINRKRWAQEDHTFTGTSGSYRSMRAYQIAEDMIRNQMDFPEDSIEDEKLFLATIKALTDKLYEKAADMFSSAGSAPDEGEF